MRLLLPVVAAILACATAAPVAAAAPSDAARERLVALLEDVTGAAGATYDTRDSSGLTVDTIKVLDRPGGGYLGVYHVNEDWRFSVRLATSSDLETWQYVRTLEPDATDPTLAAAPGGGYLLAFEKRDDSGASALELRTYESVEALLDGTHARRLGVERSLSSRHEGTPSIQSIDPATGAAQVRFHYYDAERGWDRNACGTLREPSTWSAGVATDVNGAFAPPFAGSVGDRDHVMFDGHPFTLVEVQSTIGDWGSWRVYLRDDTTGTTTRLAPRTPAGTSTFANPAISAVTGPGGGPVLAVSMYVHSAGGAAAPGEAGPLVYHVPYEPAPASQPAEIPPCPEPAIAAAPPAPAAVAAPPPPAPPAPVPAPTAVETAPVALVRALRVARRQTGTTIRGRLHLSRAARVSAALSVRRPRARRAVRAARTLRRTAQPGVTSLRIALNRATSRRLRRARRLTVAVEVVVASPEAGPPIRLRRLVRLRLPAPEPARRARGAA